MESIPDRPAKSRLTRGRAFALAWLTFTVLYSLQSYTFNLAVGRSQTWRTFLGLELVFIGTLAIQTPLILWLGRRIPIVGAGRWKRIAAHVLTAMILAFAQRFLVEAVQRTVRATPENPFNWTRVAQVTLGSFETGVFVYFLVLLGMHFWDYYERYSEERLRAAHLKADLSAAQLEALRTQVQPHFLFNTLNAISVLIEEDPKTARAMIGHLGDFLRATLAEDSRQEISLRRELELLEHYLKIEQTRFGERLQVETKVAPAALEARVPALLLQPLVENAIRHGFSKRPGPGRIEITASVHDASLLLSVRDFSPSMNGGDTGHPIQTTRSNGTEPSAPGSGLGIGLRNTAARLRELYGDAQVLTRHPILENGREIGTEVTVSIGRGPGA